MIIQFWTGRRTAPELFLPVESPFPPLLPPHSTQRNIRIWTQALSPLGNAVYAKGGKDSEKDRIGNPVAR